MLDLVPSSSEEGDVWDGSSSAELLEDGEVAPACASDSVIGNAVDVDDSGELPSVSVSGNSNSIQLGDNK